MRQSESKEVNELIHPYGNTIIAFGRDDNTKLGTSSLVPGGSYIYESETTEKISLTFLNDSPFVEDPLETNQSLTIRQDARGEYPYQLESESGNITLVIAVMEFGVQEGKIRLYPDGKWRVQLLLEKSPSTVIFNKVLSKDTVFELTRIPGDTPISIRGAGPDTSSATLFQGTYRVKTTGPIAGFYGNETGGTDEADIIIGPDL